MHLAAVWRQKKLLGRTFKAHRRETLEIGASGLIQPDGCGPSADFVYRSGHLEVAAVLLDAGANLINLFELTLDHDDGAFAQRPLTKFESRGQRLGHSIRDLYFRRRQIAPAAR